MARDIRYARIGCFQSIGLIKCKMAIKKVKDPSLRTLYTQTIQSLENNLKELLIFYPQAPNPEHRHAKEDPDTAFYAGDLLGLAKTTVRNYAIAITETATPQLRQVLVKQLNAAIQLHANVFYFMYERNYYPSYDLQQLLANDVKIAEKALSM